MTDINPLVAQEEIDRLVDGELDDEQRRRLIARLEAADGWRLCALAFLEQQEWKQVLSSCASETRISRHAETAVAVSDTPRGSTRIATTTAAWRMWTALTAIILLAFAGGVGAGRFSAFESVGPIDRRLIVETDRTAAEQNEARAPSPVSEQTNVVDPGDTKGLETGRSSDAIRLPMNSGDVQIVGLVRMTDDSSAEPDYVMPVFAGGGLDQDWLNRMPLPYSADDVRRLKQDGYQVRQRRRLMQVNLVDGRQLAIPFGTIQLEYVGHEFH